MLSVDRITYFVKTNKLVITLFVVILFLLLKSLPGAGPLRTTQKFVAEDVSEMARQSQGGVVGRPSISPVPPIDGSGAPRLDVSDRKFVVTTSLSLVVENVAGAISEIENKLKGLNGILVNKSLNRPDEAQTGYITVRVLSDRADDFLNDIKGMAVKVVYENTNGSDVTDEYYDIQTRLSTLEKNKARFETIMDQATSTEDILNIQNQIFALQDQIDNLKGRMQYLDETSKTVLISISLSTDELSLPYVPDKSWRPSVIFKEAVRSLVLNLRGIGEWLIWIGVYSVFWIPAGVILWWFVFRKTSSSSI